MQPFAALLCTLAALVSAAALPPQADTALTSLQRREYYGAVFEEGAYFDSALIDYVGTETYEQWVTAQLRPGVYQFLRDFGISREELAEIVQPDIYEQYIRYWPDEELLRGRPGWTQWLWLLGKGANADLASLLPPEEDTAGLIQALLEENRMMLYAAFCRYLGSEEVEAWIQTQENAWDAVAWSNPWSEDWVVPDLIEDFGITDQELLEFIIPYAQEAATDPNSFLAWRVPSDQEIIEHGGYVDIRLINYIGSDAFEAWLRGENRSGGKTVYDLLRDFGISREELAEIVHPDIYEQYIRYWPEE